MKCTFIGAGPVLPVPDVERAVAYYCSVLGFARDFVMGDPPDHGSVTRGRVGIQFTLAPKPYDAAGYPGWTYLFVENIDALAQEYERRGAAFTQPLTTHEHGMREFEIQDVHGFRLRFGHYV